MSLLVAEKSFAVADEGTGAELGRDQAAAEVELASRPGREGSWWHRAVYGALALGLTLGFFYCICTFHCPADPGTDQNGYLVGGKQISRTLSMALRPVRPGSETGTTDEGGPVGQFDPHQFVGSMWVGAGEGTPQERFYPKYPLGYPLIVAAVLWVCAALPDGHALGVLSAYWINPVAMTLSVLATYRLARRFMGGYGSLLAAMVYATSPASMLLGESNNSHATAAFCAVWGMERLFAWWEGDGRRGMINAILAGLLLGYAATIRYSEGTLVLPLALVALLNLRVREARSWRQTAALLGAWAAPLAILVIYNLASMGTLTGYDPTNESSGFAWANAADNWETMLRHLNTNGLSMLLPLSIGGLGLMLRRQWKQGVVLAAWILPCLIIYTFYYWAPDTNSISYVRFFQTILPGLALTAVWFLMQAVVQTVAAARNGKWQVAAVGGALLAGVATAAIVGMALRTASLDPSGEAIIAPARWAGAVAAGVGVALLALAALQPHARLAAVGVGLFLAVTLAMQSQSAAAQLDMNFSSRLSLATDVHEVLRAVPAGATVFCPDPQMLNDLQFAGEYALYQGETFNRSWIQGLMNGTAAADQPQTLDYNRRHSLYVRLNGLSYLQLEDAPRQLIDASLTAGRRVFFVVPRRENEAPIGVALFARQAPRPAGGLGARAAGLLGRGGGGGAARTPNVIPQLLRQLIAPDRFEAKVVKFWGEPPPPPSTVNAGMRMRGQRFGPVPGGPRYGTWEVIEVSRKVPTP